MSEPECPYSPECFNALPDIDEARDLLTKADVALLKSKVGELFIKHKVENLYGICIPHSHFDLTKDEILVNIVSVAVPWNKTHNNPELENVKPSSWLFKKEGLKPFEYTYDTEHSLPDLQFVKPFLKELTVLVDQLGLSDKVGLCVLPLAVDGMKTSGLIEITEGRANITLPVDLGPQKADKDELIEAVWGFESVPQRDRYGNIEVFKDPLVLIDCKVQCALRDGTHSKRLLKL